MSQPTAVKLEGGLSIVDAATQRDTLLQLLAGAAGDLALDLSEVCECDSAGIQLLLALARSLHERGHQLQLAAMSDTVRQALLTYGLDASLATPAQAQAGEPA